MTIAFKEIQAYAKEFAAIVRDHVGELRKSFEARAERAEKAHDELVESVRALTADNAAMRKELDDALGTVQELLRVEADAIRNSVPQAPAIDEDAIARRAAELVPVPQAPAIDEDAIARRAAELVPVPQPEPGARGEDGRDALDLEILPQIDEGKSYPRNTYAQHAGGVWRSFQQTTGMHGWECVLRGVASIEARMADDRTIEIATVLSDGETKTYQAPIPVVLDRGPYAVERSYTAGDGVTFGGQYWIAQDNDPVGKPGEPGSKGWRLAVRKGRDASSPAKLGGSHK